jgi:hypothetical protein
MPLRFEHCSCIHANDCHVALLHAPQDWPSAHRLYTRITLACFLVRINLQLPLAAHLTGGAYLRPNTLHPQSRKCRPRT